MSEKQNVWEPVATGSPPMAFFTRCEICGRTLKPDRKNVDTCSEQCFQRLLNLQRRGM